MNIQKIPSSKSAQQGIVLMEAMIAVLIFSMGVLAVVGLQAAMIKNTVNSKFRADASYIAQQKIGMMWADPANAGNPASAAIHYVESSTDISALLPGGLRTVTQPTSGQFRVIVGWTEPGETPAALATTGPCFMLVAHCYSATASINGG